MEENSEYQKIKDLKWGESLTLDTYKVKRVPGGLIYKNLYEGTLVFVPFVKFKHPDNWTMNKN